MNTLVLRSWWNRWESSYINWPQLSTFKHILQGCSKAPRTELGDSGNSHCYSNGETVLPINSTSPLSAVVLKWSDFAAEGVSGSVWRHCLMSWLRMGRSVLPASHEWAETRKASKHPVMHRPAPSPPPPQHQRIIQSKIPNSARLRNPAQEQWLSHSRALQSPGGVLNQELLGSTLEFLIQLV